MSMMRRRALAGLTAGFCLMLAACSAPAETDTAPEVAPTTSDATVIYLVRHAEKTAERPDPELADAGKARAEALADRLEGAGLTAIFSTDTTRTRETAAPIAARLGLEVEYYANHQTIDFVERLKAMPGRVLVVGHSNTTPVLTDLLGGDMVSPIDEAGEYDRLYVVTLGGDGNVTSVLERYGAAYVPAGAE